jgi:hypothetical protein
MSDVITNEAQLRLASGLLVWPTNTVVACLYTSSATFTKDSSAYSSANELSSINGYTQLNKSVTGKTISLDDTNDQIIYDCDDIVWTATSGDIGPARYCALVDTQGGANKYLYIVDFLVDKLANSLTDFRVSIDASGLFRSRQG